MLEFSVYEQCGYDNAAHYFLLPIKRSMHTRFALASAFALGALLSPSIARDARSDIGAYHELTNSRATLVLRDQTHVSMTMYIDYTDALHRVLAPQRTMTEFVVAYATMPLPALRVELQKAQTRFISQLRLVSVSGGDVVLRNWSWPDAAAVRDMLQQQTMQAVVAPADHAHAPPMEIHVDANASLPISAMSARFPVEFQRVLVVSYKPNQVWG